MLRQAGDYYVVGLRREHRRPDHRHRLGRDQHHRQPRRLLQRPSGPDGPGGPRRRHPSYPEIRLDDFQQAIDDLDAGKVRGRAILVPEPLMSPTTARTVVTAHPGGCLDLHHRQVPHPARARRQLAGDLARVHRGDPRPRPAACGSTGRAASTTRTSTSSSRRSATATPVRRTCSPSTSRPRRRSCRRTSPRRRASSTRRCPGPTGPSSASWRSTRAEAGHRHTGRMPSLSLCLLLDEQADQAVRRLWRQLEDDGLPSLTGHTHGRHTRTSRSPPSGRRPSTRCGTRWPACPRPDRRA